MRQYGPKRILSGYPARALILASWVSLGACQAVSVELDPAFAPEQSAPCIGEDCMPDASFDEPDEDCTPATPWNCDCWVCDDEGSRCEFEWMTESVVHIECIDGCLQTTQCSAGVQCVYGFETGQARCGDDVDCDVLGCTGVPMCGAIGGGCEPCGCCDFRERDFCHFDAGSEREWAYYFDEEDKCFYSEECRPDQECAIEDDDEHAHCRRKRNAPGGSDDG